MNPQDFGMTRRAHLRKRVWLRKLGLKPVFGEKFRETATRIARAMGVNPPPSKKMARYFLATLPLAPGESKDFVAQKSSPKSVPFYESDAWRDVRYRALKACGRRCLVCGRGPQNGAVLHVDHIKPRSLFPELELDIDNLQVLCEDCNLGKSNRDEIDWRFH